MYIEIYHLVLAAVTALTALAFLGFVCYHIVKRWSVKQFCKNYFNISAVYPEPHGLTLELDIRRASVFVIHPTHTRDEKHMRAVMNAQNLLDAVKVG